MTRPRKPARSQGPALFAEVELEERASAEREAEERARAGRDAADRVLEARARAALHQELRARPAAIRAGVDEAGLGPLLGPLTLGYSAFRTSSDDLWRELADVASRELADDASRLVVADSKLVFTRNPRGARRLEATALAFLAQRRPDRRAPECGRDLLACIPADLAPRAAFADEAWHAHLAARLPAAIEPEQLVRWCERVALSLERASIELCCAGMRVLPVAELNGSFAITGNKSLTHWHVSAAVLRHLWTNHAHEGLDVLVDRHGGRMRYGWLLRGTFLDADVHVIDEQSERSEYFVETAAGADGPARWMRIAFAERAESASFPVALASCLAKYARETCMDAFNACFLALQPGLKPTAGYTSDGRRWLEDAREAIVRSGLALETLVRER
jgi:ribonuclease HII